MRKFIIVFLLASVSMFQAGCARYHLNKGNREFEGMSYVKAIKHYNKSLNRREIQEARINLAHSYRLTNDVKNAEKEYARALTVPETAPINLFYYSKMLMEQERYEEAKENLKLYLAKEPNDVVAQMLLASCNSVASFKIDTTLYKVDRVEIGDVASVFGCVSYKDGMVCTAEKNVRLNSKKNPWTGKSFLDLYFLQKDEEGRWLPPASLKGHVNGQYHEGPAAFTKDGNVTFFTRSNYYKGTVRKSSKNINNLKIFRAELIDGKWKNLEEMPFCSDEYSVGHPSLAPDERTLYFVSDMPGGYGGTDIYLSFFDGGKWSPPMNLGPVINTPGNEMFPYSHEDGSFYFASNAHNSMGGLDVFVTSYEGKKWLRPENLNYPLNSSRDDFAYIMQNDSVGLISSTRSDTDRVYQFTKRPPTFKIEGTVADGKTKSPLAGATVKILGNKRILLSTDKSGKYSSDLEPGSNYLVLASQKGYFSHSVDINTAAEKYSKTFIVDFNLTEMVIERPIVLENIYYDLDKWEIRADAAKELDKLVRVLNDNPTINIELSSHTDSRAGDQYNLILSDKRAKAAVDYIITRGISAARLTWKGYGESKLVNKCNNNITCTEEEHQQNRRTEFKVIKIGQVTAGK